MRIQHTAWALVVVAMACSSTNTSGGAAAAGGATTAATPTSGGTESGGATAANPAPGGPAVPWPQMNHEQKMEYMQGTVMPEMRRMFQAHDAQRFARFTCGTCHGANAREVNFRMPNGIAPLNPASIPGMFQSQDPMHVFMTQRLWPRMTALLGAQPYNPQTHQGFGCLGCHGMAGGPPAAPPAAAPGH